ncbi:fibrobacter succinogenes major paralogous domain-containing protein [Flavobacterium sp.]|uniref:fibrobacter succinogenes major paralogous domain-containing protein n=1 Tax=Flavobacterium sp. TaxID=239 RepID=UPI003752D740
MKKTILILVLTISSVLFLGCSSSGSDSNPNDNNNNTLPVSDIDGNIYNVIQIGSKTWMQKNLNVSKYRNGDIIPQITDPTQWKNTTTGAWCYYKNDINNGQIYGKLYNWYAVNDPRGLSPQGWHISSNDEWVVLIGYLGGDMLAGYTMKELGVTHWSATTPETTNSSGFMGLPGGFSSYGAFSGIGLTGWWWTSSQETNLYAYMHTLYYAHGKVPTSTFEKRYGMSVRCIRN